MQNISNERTMEILQSGLTWTNEQRQAIIVALTAVNKQIEKNVIKDDNSKFICPMCKTDVSTKYCSNCGQKVTYVDKETF